MPAHADTGSLGPMHHDRCVPANMATNGAFDGFIAGKPRFHFGGDGVDVVGGTKARYAHVALSRPAQQ